MKKLLLATVLTLSATTSFAEVRSMTVCKALSSFSETTMRARQVGMPMADIVDAWGSDPENSLGQVMVNLTIMAYGRPKFSTKAMQRESVTEFGNDVLLLCIKGDL